jgi:hypothetical protein
MKDFPVTVELTLKVKAEDAATAFDVALDAVSSCDNVELGLYNFPILAADMKE